VVSTNDQKREASEEEAASWRCLLHDASPHSALTISTQRVGRGYGAQPTQEAERLHLVSGQSMLLKSVEP